jgi:hypothetical protein
MSRGKNMAQLTKKQIEALEEEFEDIKAIISDYEVRMNQIRKILANREG